MKNEGGSIMLKRVIALIAAGALLLCSASGLALTAQDAAQLNPEETDEDLLSRYRFAWKDVLATDYTLVLVASDTSAMVPGMEDFSTKTIDSRTNSAPSRCGRGALTGEAPGG